MEKFYFLKIMIKSIFTFQIKLTKTLILPLFFSIADLYNKYIYRKMITFPATDVLMPGNIDSETLTLLFNIFRDTYFIIQYI